MDTAEVIFNELKPVQAEAIKNQFDAYVAPGVKLFFIDQVDLFLPDQSVIDFFISLEFDEQQISDLLAYRIWGFYYRD